MFGAPCPLPPGKVIFSLVWSHYLKTDGTAKRKARCTCDGSPRSGQAHTLDHTYASCIDQNTARIFYANAALQNHGVCGADASNAFAEAAGPRQEYYIQPDAAFRNWWTRYLNRLPIPEGYVVPVLKNMQGHPEGPRLWARHIHKLLLLELNLSTTTQEPCLYTGTQDGHTIFVICQVDDFAVLEPSAKIVQDFLVRLDSLLLEPLKMQGILKYFNGVSLVQSRDYV